MFNLTPLTTWNQLSDAFVLTVLGASVVIVFGVGLLAARLFTHRRVQNLAKRLAARQAQNNTADAALRLAQTKLADVEARVQRLAHMTREEARRDMLAQAQTEIQSDAASLARKMQLQAREEGERLASSILAGVLQRCAISQLNALTTTTFTLPTPEMKGRVVGREGRNARAFEAETGVQLVFDDSPDTVILSCFDPLRRALACELLSRLVSDGRITPTTIQTTLPEAREAVRAQGLEQAHAAASEVNLTDFTDEEWRLLGELHFRYSSRQNVLRHSVEVAFLAGALADELHLDASRARRVGFLHDIGKALTRETHGSHAQLGADFLRDQKEDEVICEAVAAHHGESASDGGVWGLLCRTADALSSARLGARTETEGTYYERLQTLEQMALQKPGVTQAFALQAGRDLRIMVDAAKLNDTQAATLARTLATEISAQKVKCPGLVRVTVIRELKCVEYAK